MAATWQLSGIYAEACNCEATCPCVVLGAPTDGECTVVIAWHIERGRFDGEVLDGLNAVLAAHVPGHMAQVKWKVALYVDERGTGTQRDALVKIFSGAAGGPPAALTPLVGEVLGARPARIEFSADGRRRSFRVEGVGEAEIEAVTGQQGREVTLDNAPLTPVPGVPAVVARSKRATYRDHGLALDVSGKNGFYSAFQYQP